MAKEAISTPDAPIPIGPYSQAVKTSNFIFLSGQIALGNDGGLVGDSDVRLQTRAVLQNVANILRSCGLSLSSVVKTTVFLADMADYSAFNDVYREFFQGVFPARSVVGVAGLPKGARVEMEAVAAVE